MTDQAASRIVSAIKAQHEMGLKGENWDNYAIARETLHDELGYNGATRDAYEISASTRDTLIVHGRQDTAHALANTTSILTQIKILKRSIYGLGLLVCIFGAVSLFGWPK